MRVKDDLGQMIRDSAEDLRHLGIESPLADVEIMLMHILGCRRVDLYLGDIDLLNEQLLVFKRYLEERSRRRPVQYITGSANFMGFDFTVRPGVFIPRPETELLVEKMLKTIHNPQSTVHSWKILDLCTGSGCIAVSLAKLVPNCEVFATDISDLALEAARGNARLHGLEDKINFLQGDLFDALLPFDGLRFDAIISNPPYIKTGELGGLPLEVKCEPQLALDGGEDGNYFYNKIQSSYRKYTTGSPHLFIERPLWRRS